MSAEPQHRGQAMIALLGAASRVRKGGWIKGAPTHVLAELLQDLEERGWYLLHDVEITRRLAERERAGRALYEAAVALYANAAVAAARLPEDEAITEGFDPPVQVERPDEVAAWKARFGGGMLPFDNAYWAARNAGRTIAEAQAAGVYAVLDAFAAARLPERPDEGTP